MSPGIRCQVLVRTSGRQEWLYGRIEFFVVADHFVTSRTLFDPWQDILDLVYLFVDLDFLQIKPGVLVSDPIHFGHGVHLVARKGRVFLYEADHTTACILVEPLEYIGHFGQLFEIDVADVDLALGLDEGV